MYKVGDTVWLRVKVVEIDDTDVDNPIRVQNEDCCVDDWPEIRDVRADASPPPPDPESLLRGLREIVAAIPAPVGVAAAPVGAPDFLLGDAVIVNSPRLGLVGVSAEVRDIKDPAVYRFSIHLDLGGHLEGNARWCIVHPCELQHKPGSFAASL